MSLEASGKEYWLKFENELRLKGYSCLAGIDEAGRGPLAGPVVAACIHIPPHIFIEGVNDSKKMTPLQRDALYKTLTSHPQIHYGVGVVDALEIDKINILQASIKAMQLAYEQMGLPIDHLLVDGVQLFLNIPALKIIKGDAKSHLIAAASIIAKVTRDRLMDEYHEKWPIYDFKQHKGYGTLKHRNAIMKHGPCPIHRMTFEPIRSLNSNLIGSFKVFE